jgi:hypothetical protein
MSTAGPNSPGTLADDAAIGTLTWGTTSNAAASDDAYASVTGAGAAADHYLKASNFGFSIPSGATIDGITVEIEMSKTGPGAPNDSTVKIVKADGSIGSTNKGTAVNITTTDTYRTYGGAADLWSETWTDADINDVDFGVVFSSTHSGNSTTRIDHIRITVNYTAGGGAATHEETMQQQVLRSRRRRVPTAI